MCVCVCVGAGPGNTSGFFCGIANGSSHVPDCGEDKAGYSLMSDACDVLPYKSLITLDTTKKDFWKGGGAISRYLSLEWRCALACFS